MKPHPFAYAAARDTDDALALLAEGGEHARPLAGGQSLVQLMNARLSHPSALVDLNPVSELAGLDTSDGGLRVGAMVRSGRLERDPSVRARLPALADAAARVGHPAVRNRGTIGGNLSYADPAGNLPVIALMTGAELHVRSAGGERTVPAAEFFRDAHVTALEPGELLCEAHFPDLPAGAGSAFVEVSRRSRGWGLAGAAAAVWLDGDGTLAGARVALGGVAATPVRATAAEDLLTGRPPGAEAWAEAAAAAREAVATPRSDLHASAAHRRRLIGTVVERALAAAADRAEGAR